MPKVHTIHWKSLEKTYPIYLHTWFKLKHHGNPYNNLKPCLGWTHWSWDRCLGRLHTITTLQHTVVGWGWHAVYLSDSVSHCVWRGVACGACEAAVVPTSALQHTIHTGVSLSAHPTPYHTHLTIHTTIHKVQTSWWNMGNFYYNSISKKTEVKKPTNIYLHLVKKFQGNLKVKYYWIKCSPYIR